MRTFIIGLLLVVFVVIPIRADYEEIIEKPWNARGGEYSDFDLFFYGFDHYILSVGTVIGSTATELGVLFDYTIALVSNPTQSNSEAYIAIYKDKLFGDVSFEPPPTPTATVYATPEIRIITATPVKSGNSVSQNKQVVPTSTPVPPTPVPTNTFIPTWTPFPTPFPTATFTPVPEKYPHRVHYQRNSRPHSEVYNDARLQIRYENWQGPEINPYKVLEIMDFYQIPRNYKLMLCLGCGAHGHGAETAASYRTLNGVPGVNFQSTMNIPNRDNQEYFQFVYTALMHETYHVKEQATGYSHTHLEAFNYGWVTDAYLNTSVTWDGFGGFFLDISRVHAYYTDHFQGNIDYSLSNGNDLGSRQQMSWNEFARTVWFLDNLGSIYQ